MAHGDYFIMLANLVEQAVKARIKYETKPGGSLRHLLHRCDCLAEPGAEKAYCHPPGSFACYVCGFVSHFLPYIDRASNRGVQTEENPRNNRFQVKV